MGEALFAQVGDVLQAQGLKVGTGTIVDATIIGAPSSTKNAGKQRDPEMHQTRKGQQWYFGMKMHIGVDSRSGLAHSAVVTAANVHDKHPLPDLLHGNEQRVYGDSAYASQKALIASKAPNARDFTNQRVRKGGEVDEAERSKNRNKSRVRARVEHVFAVVKRLWGFARCATGAWSKTPCARSWRWGWPISAWRASTSWDECVCSTRPERARGRNGTDTARNPSACAFDPAWRNQRISRLTDCPLFSVALNQPASTISGGGEESKRFTRSVWPLNAC